MLEGLSYVHQRQLVHKNMTPFSVLFSRDKKRLKIGGFGLGCIRTTIPTGGECIMEFSGSLLYMH